MPQNEETRNCVRSSFFFLQLIFFCVIFDSHLNYAHESCHCATSESRPTQVMSNERECACRQTANAIAVSHAEFPYPHSILDWLYSASQSSVVQGLRCRRFEFEIISIKFLLLNRLNKSHRRFMQRLEIFIASCHEMSTHSQIRHRLNRRVFFLFLFRRFIEISTRDFVNHLFTYFAIDKINFWMKFMHYGFSRSGIKPHTLALAHGERVNMPHCQRAVLIRRTAKPSRSIYTLRRHE